MYIDNVEIKGLDKKPFMPIEIEMEASLLKLGFKVEHINDGLLWAERENLFFYVFATSKFPDRFTISMEAYMPEDFDDKDLLVTEALNIAKDNGAPKINVCVYEGKCYVSQDFRRRCNAISPARLQRNIDEFYAGYDFFVLNEKLVYESYKALD